MGSFYGNVTLLDVALPAVREACPDPAYAIADGSDVVVYLQGDDAGPQSGSGFSTALGCIAVSVGVHDDDIFFFEVHDNGQAVPPLLEAAVPVMAGDAAPSSSGQLRKLNRKSCVA